MTAKKLLTIVICSGLPAFADVFYVDPATSDVTVGQSFTLDVDVSGATDLYGYQFDLGFDPSILQATTITEGGFLTGVGATTFFPGSIDNVGGDISFNADILNGAASGAAGSGVLITFGFTAIGSGSSSVDIFNVTALNSFGEGLTVDTNGGTVDVTTSAVPEPATTFPLLVAILGLGAVSIVRRRRTA